MNAKLNGDAPVTVKQCNDRHGTTRWILGMLGALVLCALATAGGAYTSAFSTSNKFDVLTSQISGQQRSLNEIRIDVREIRQELRSPGGE